MAALSWVGEEISAAGCGLLLIVVSPAIVGSILTRHGTAAQKERWLRGIGSGATKVAFAITEADAGSNSHNLATSLRRERDRYMLRGQEDVHLRRRGRRRGAGGGAHAARRRPAQAAVTGDRRRRRPGFTRQEIPMAVRGADKRWTLFFDDVELEEERLIKGENGGLGDRVRQAEPRAHHGASICTGVARLALERGASYAREREVWGQPIGAHQGVAHPLAEAKIELELARLMTRKAAALYDAGVPGAGEAANMAKYAAAEAAIHCVDRAIQAHGATASRSSTAPRPLGARGSPARHRSRARWCSITWPSTRSGCRSPTSFRLPRGSTARLARRTDAEDCMNCAGGEAIRWVRVWTKRSP
jgi:alkylation response protein AidB-like acyl-CoA dehydrogenase